MKAVLALLALGLLIGGCGAEAPSPPLSASPSQGATPEACDSNQIKLVPGRMGAAMGTMYLTFRAELAGGPPCLIATWPSVEMLDGSSDVVGRVAAQPDAIPRETLLSTSLEFHLGWASWCGPGPFGPFMAHVGLVSGSPSTLEIPEGFGPSGCQGGSSILFVEPGW